MVVLACNAIVQSLWDWCLRMHFVHYTWNFERVVRVIEAHCPLWHVTSRPSTGEACKQLDVSYFLVQQLAALHQPQVLAVGTQSYGRSCSKRNMFIA